MCHNRRVEGSAATWTVDELAHRTGMTVRNIRAHQSRGLLEPPVVRGRTGYYGPEHAARVAQIQRLQAEGFNLEAIRRLLAATPEADEAPIRLLLALGESYGSEAPQPVTLQDLAADWGPDGAGELDRSVRLGLLRRTEDGGFVYPRPSLVRAAKQVAALGIPLSRQLDLIELMRAPASDIAEGFVELFVEQVWRPFLDSGSPDDRWPQVDEALQRMRPLVGEVLWSVFAAAMDDAVERTLGRELERLAARA